MTKLRMHSKVKERIKKCIVSREIRLRTDQAWQERAHRADS